MKISRFAVNHPVVIGMLLIVLVVFGLVSITGMNVAFMSDISMPSVIVIAVYPGASAEDVEEDVTDILENDFVTLPNFKGISSVSQNSSSIVTISFQDGVDPYDQLPEVRNRINMLMDNLPDGLSGTPNAVVGGSSMIPTITFSIEGGDDTVRLTEFVEKTLRPRLTGIDGVAEVSIEGGSSLRVNIKLRLHDLEAKGISVSQVYQVLNYGNVNLPVGSAEYENRTIDVRYSGGFSSLDDIRNLPVGSSSDENPVIIRLSDVADISLSSPEKTSYVTDGEKPIIVADVTKRSDGNTLEIINQVKTVLTETEAETAGAVTFNIINDDSRIIKSSMRTVITSGIAGIIMAIIVLFLFLNDARATFIIGISIPLSILFTFIGMKLMGITINLMSLSGMVVALGMIVDGSIVMIEQVYRYYQRKNPDGSQLISVRDSIYRGSDEVSGSIFASTATTVVVFLPITTISGIVGMILKDVAWTLVLALTASFLVAVIVVPFLMRMMLKPRVLDGSSGSGDLKEKKPTLFMRIIAKLEIKYQKMLRWALHSWKFIVTIAIIILVLSMFSVTALGLTFIPSTDNGDFYIDLDFPNGQTLEQTDKRMRQAELLIREYVPEIDNMVFYTGENQSTVTGGAASNTGYVHVVLVPVSQRKRDIHDIYLQLQQILSESIPDVKVKTSNGGFDKLLGYVSSGGGYGITLVSEDMTLLYTTALRLQDQLKKDSDVVVTSLDTSFDTKSLIIDMSHDYMSSLGLTSYEAGLTSAILFQGVDSGKFRNKADNSLYDIRLFSDITDVPITQDVLAAINVKSLTGSNVSFANLSSMRVEQSVSRINHTDRSKTITVSATLAGEDTTGVSSRMNAYLENNPLPSGVRSRTGGIMELLGDSIPPMVSALLIALFLVYTVMVLQFERFRQPLLVMLTIPFCVVGVVIGLLIFGSTMSLLAFLGIIALGGVVVNNGIILIDYINLLRRHNGSEEYADKPTNSNESNLVETDERLEENVVNGASSRLRPVFMTTLTTMLGVVPMAVATGEGAELYAPLGQAISGGLLTSTLITLFIIPVLYFVTEKRRLHKTKDTTPKNLVMLFLIVGLSLFMPKTRSIISAQERYKLSDLLQEANVNNPSLQIAALETEQARLSLMEARSYMMPKIEAAAYGQYEQNPSTIESLVPGFIDSFNELIGGVNTIGKGMTGLSNYLHIPTQSWNNIDTYSPGDPSHWAAQFTGTLTQPIFTWGKILNSVALAKTGVEAKTLQRLVKKREIETQILAKTVAVFYMVKIEESIEKELQYGHRLLNIAEESVKNGMILNEELKNVSMKVLELETSLSNIKFQTESLLLSVKELTGIQNITTDSIDFSFIPVNVIEKISERTTVTDATDYLKNVSNESELLQLRIKAAEQQKKITSSETWGKPDIAFKFGYTFTSQSFTSDFIDKGNWNITVAIAINSTLFDGLKSFAVDKSAKAGQSIAVNQLQQDMATLETQLRTLDSSIAYKVVMSEYLQKKIDTNKNTTLLKKSEYESGYGDEQTWIQSEIEAELSLISKYQNDASLFADYASYQYLCGLLPADYLE